MATEKPASRGVLSLDTSAEAEAEQIRIWRSLSTVEIADLVRGACRAVRALAIAGLRERHPQASEDEIVRRFVELTAGSDLAREVYGDRRPSP